MLPMKRTIYYPEEGEGIGCFGGDVLKSRDFSFQDWTIELQCRGNRVSNLEPIRTSYYATLGSCPLTMVAATR
jgi:hypothetical protein